MRSALVVLFVVAGCGDDGVHHLPDGPLPPDASADAPTSGTVTLTVTNVGAPVAGVAVYFQNADSSVVATLATDVNGVASATMEPGGFVTAVNPVPNGKNDDVRTFAGVKPGDQLRLDEVLSGAALVFNVTLPVDPAATNYLLYSSCNGGFPQSVSGSGSGFTPTISMVIDGCTTVDFAVMTSDGNGLASKAFFHPAQAVANGVDVTLSDTYVDQTTYRIQYTNIPAAYSSLSLRHLLATTHGMMIQTFAGIDVTSGSGSVAMAQPPVVAPIAVIESDLPAGLVGTHAVLDWGPQANPTALDLATTLLPDYTVAPTLDVAGHRVTWTADAGEVQPEFVRTDMSIFRASTVKTWLWKVVAPYSGTTLVLPVLPTGATDLNPTTDDVATFTELVTVKAPGGYDAVRARALNLLNLEQFVVGASGRALVESIGLSRVLRTVNPVTPRNQAAAPHRIGRR